MANNSDEMMFDYLLQMGAMQPEQTELKRKQALVDALRQGSLTAPQGQMVSGHYVAPGLGGLMSQLGQAYAAKQGQMGVDQSTQALSTKQRQMLEELRRRRMAQQPTGVAPSGTQPTEGYVPPVPTNAYEGY